MQRVDYDSIAHLYDAPDREHEVDPDLISFLDERDDFDQESASILDIGCGTGKQVAANREAFPHARVVGADLFLGMLKVGEANGRGRWWVQTDASSIGFGGRTFDYVSNQFSYAHIQDKPTFFAEAHRILRPGGRFVLTNIDPWSMDGWILYHYFPAARTLDHADFLEGDALEELARAAGFIEVTIRRESGTPDERLGAFLEYASERHRASHFMAMSDLEYENGLEMLRSDVRKLGEDAVFASESCRLTLKADRAR